MLQLKQRSFIWYKNHVNFHANQISWFQCSMASPYQRNFCLRPSAKDQGITSVVFLVVLVHLVHFLIKRNLREKNSSQPGFKPGTSRSQVRHSSNWAKETLLFKYLKIIYLLQKSRRRPWTSIGWHLFYERVLSQWWAVGFKRSNGVGLPLRKKQFLCSIITRAHLKSHQEKSVR